MDANFIKMENKEYILTKRLNLSEVIKTKRIKIGMTQAQLAEKTNCKTLTINRIEKNVFSPNADVLYLILKALDLPLKIGNEEI